LPNLPFEDKKFDLALSSHFLFLYSEHLDFEFHLNSILEMLRVSQEARIFPIVGLDNNYSPHLKNVIVSLEQRGYKSEILKTDYEFQKGANEMLKVSYGTN